jgi:hypothetical protein
MPNKKIEKINIDIRSEEREVEIWKGRVKLSESFLKTHYVDNANRWRDFYRGKHFKHIDIDGMSNPLVINYTYSTIKTILPGMYFQDPYIFLEPTDNKGVSNKEDAEDYINNVWYEAEIKRQNKRISLDYLVLGYGVGKLGYETKTKENEDKGQLVNDFNSELITEEYPYFLRHSPYDMVFDCEAKHFDNFRWVGAKYYLPKEDVFAIFKPHTDFEGSSMVDLKEIIDKADLSQQYKDNDLKRVIVYEIHDLVDKKIMWFCSEYDKFLRKIENPYKIKGSNWKFLFTNEVPDILIPISDVSQIEGINFEMDITRTMALNHLKKSQRKILIEDDAFLNKEEKAKFLNGVDLQGVILRSGAIKDQKVAQWNATAVDYSFYNTSKELRTDFNNVSGVGDQQRGVSTTKEQTAYETSVVDKNSKLKNSDRVDAITDFCKDIARDLLLIVQKFPVAEKDYYVKRTGEIKRYSSDKIQGSYKPRIEIGSTLQRDLFAERQFFVQFGQQILTAVRADGTPAVDVPEFIRYAMERFAVSPDIVKKVVPLESIAPPVQEQQQEEAPQEGVNPDNVAQLVKEMLAAEVQGGQGGMV